MSCYSEQQVLCMYYGSARGCNFGDRCRFSHSSPNSVQYCPSLFSRGYCPNGNFCNYRHVVFEDYYCYEPQYQYNNYNNYHNYNDDTSSYTKYSNYSQSECSSINNIDSSTKIITKNNSVRMTEKSTKSNKNFIDNSKKLNIDVMNDDDIEELIHKIINIGIKKHKSELNTSNRTIIWMMGIPGSGKSTAIKYLLETPLCKNYKNFSYTSIVTEVLKSNDDRLSVKQCYKKLIKLILRSGNLIIDSFFKSVQHIFFLQLFYRELLKFKFNIKFVFLYLDCDINTSVERQLKRGKQFSTGNNNNEVIKASDLNSNDSRRRATNFERRLYAIYDAIMDDELLYKKLRMVNTNTTLINVQNDIMKCLKPLL